MTALAVWTQLQPSMAALDNRFMISIPAEVSHFLQTGQHDSDYGNWPGKNYFESARQADAILRDALTAAVLERRVKLKHEHCVHLTGLADLAAITRAKVVPMVTGLFPAVERPQIMATLERSVVFLLPENIESILRSHSGLSSSWTLANMYLLSFGAEPTSETARGILGMSRETTCYLTIDYLRDDHPDSLDDYLVHEAAHVFHNCRRTTVGLLETRTRQHLLNINFGKRETFAYACEAYSKIIASGKSAATRLEILESRRSWVPPDDTVDSAEYFDILQEAARARNGWMKILRRCAQSRV